MVAPGSSLDLGWSEDWHGTEAVAQLAWDAEDPHLLEVRWWTVEPVDGKEVLLALQIIEARDAEDARHLMEEAEADPESVRAWEDGNGSPVGIGYAKAMRTYVLETWERGTGAVINGDRVFLSLSEGIEALDGRWAHWTDRERMAQDCVLTVQDEQPDGSIESDVAAVRSLDVSPVLDEATAVLRVTRAGSSLTLNATNLLRQIGADFGDHVVVTVKRA